MNCDIKSAFARWGFESRGPRRKGTSAHNIAKAHLVSLGVPASAPVSVYSVEGQGLYAIGNHVDAVFVDLEGGAARVEVVRSLNALCLGLYWRRAQNDSIKQRESAKGERA